MRHLVIFGLLFSALALGTTTGCSDSNKGSDPDACTVLTEPLTRGVFELESTTEVEQSPGTMSNSCTYTWNDPELFDHPVHGPGKLPVGYHSAGLVIGPSFGSKSAADSAWQSQNDGVYADRDVQDIDGIGDRASWSTLGGGQLRILSKNQLYYVDVSYRALVETDAPPGYKVKLSSYDGMIDRAKDLAVIVLDGLN